MNSDPHDSTAWRSFGMLDADESAAYDEAARHDSHLKSATREMDRLQAALAVVASRPVMPREGHLERIQARLGQQPKGHFSMWFGISGWAAAAALALLMAWNADIIRVLFSNSTSSTAALTEPSSQVPNTHQTEATPLVSNNSAENTPPETTPAHSPESNASSVLFRWETERLTREIAALHEQVRSYQLSNQQWFQSFPGVATPVIMVMNPPGTAADDSASLAMNTSPVSQLLVETLRVSSTAKQHLPAGADAALPNNADLAFQSSNTTPDVVAESPSAIPIYDAARDAGTLVVSNLPAVAAGMEYNLWVQTSPDAKPVRIGILPDAGTSPSESFDFSLGTNTTMPSGFILTQDPKETPTAPSEKNTVLQSPQAPAP